MSASFNVVAVHLGGLVAPTWVRDDGGRKGPSTWPPFITAD
ncbi:hypothetical protein [Pendulispora rubella]